MLHYETVDVPTLELLKRLLTIDFFKNVRLVRGTSLALQIGHRKSIDLDLFGLFEPDIVTISALLRDVGDVTLLKKTPNIFIHLIDNVKVDFVNYSYPWIEKALLKDDLRLAGDKDIGAMKLSAITGRGSKKDFIDLYFLLKKYSLGELLAFYHQKYHDGSIFLVLRSLVYFDDADRQEMPDMKIVVEWADIKENITERHREYMDSL